MTEKKTISFFSAGKKRQKIVTISFCLLIATIFWFFNALNSDYTTVIHYPLLFEYNKNTVVMMQQPQRNVEVAVTGYGWDLLYHTLGFDLEPVLVKPENLDYAHKIYAGTLLNLVRAKLNDIKVNHLVKDTLHFDYEIVSSKNIYLKLDTRRLNLPKGAKIASRITIEPSYVTCTGPQSEIMTIPDSISFGISDIYIEKEFDDYVNVAYHPSPNLRQDIKQVRVKFKVK